MNANAIRAMSVRASCARWVMLAWIGACGWVHGDQAQDLAVLKSGASVVEKCEACRRLRIAGTAEAVPILAGLLNGDERVAHAARHALEGMEVPEATAALRAALAGASGAARAGLIDSLGWRRDAEAVPIMVAALTDADPIVAMAAARALGRIGGASAVAGLVGARDRVLPGVRPLVVEGILRGAEAELAAGRGREAVRLAAPLTADSESESIQVAAHLIRLRGAGDGFWSEVEAAMEAGAPAAQTAAIRAAVGADDARASEKMAAWLPRLGSAGRIGVLGALRQRGDRTVAAAVRGQLVHADPAVQAAAASTLGTLGGVDDATVLVEVATSKNERVRDAARDALAELHGGGVPAALVRALEGAGAEAQAEIIRALSVRGETSTVPALLALARGNDDGARRAAMRALSTLVDEEHLAALIQFLVEAPDDGRRDEAKGLIETMADRPGGLGKVDVTPLVKSLEAGRPEVRRALLAVTPRFVDARLRPMLRGALGDSDAGVRAAAGRALCDTHDFELLGDVMQLARGSGDETLKILALRGAARLATEDPARNPPARRVELLGEIAPLAIRVEDRRQLLSAVASVPHAEALKLAEKIGRSAAELLGDAEAAALKLAQSLATTDAALAESTLERLAAGATRESVKAEARAALKRMRPDWLCSGAYRVAGKQAQDLFDVVFPPEPGGSGGPEVAWRKAPGSADPAKAGEMDLASVVGGDHCIVYVKTRIWAPRDEDARFLIGTDDGIKLWLNGQIVHANNAVRGLTPDQDRAKVRLKAGWNDVLGKITQHTAGCGMTFRVVGADGAAIEGVRLDPR